MTINYLREYTLDKSTVRISDAQRGVAAHYWLRYTMGETATRYFGGQFEWYPTDIGSFEWDCEGESGSNAVTLVALGDALELIASGYYIDHEFELQTLRNEYMVKGARDILFHPDDADWDIELDDMVLQMAGIGRVIFG